MLRRQINRSVRPAACSLFASSQRSLTYRAPVRDQAFLMKEIYNVYPQYEKIVGDAEMASQEMVESILQECAKVSENTLFPLYQSADKEGCEILKDGNVRTPKGFKEAWDEVVAGGWQGLSSPAEYGGQGLPLSLNILKTEMMCEANWSFQMYPGLTMGAFNTLLLHGSDEQKKMCLPKFTEGSWLGTMCLTEPHCGTDLGLIKTRAEPTQTSGQYKITGTKIFISAGDHDLGENIIHIVLAKLPNAPEGTKGISLFLVPKYLPGADGTLDKSKRNVTCVSLENKMGIKGSTTCQMAFENSIGYLIGQPNQGLKYMFTFMNTARLGTALQGVAHAELSFQNALAYAKERIAMRSLTGAKAKDKPADPILVHPDVRRMLLFQKSIAEGGRAFVYDCALLADKMYYAKTTEERDKFDNELGFLTPIAKGFLTELGLEASSLGVQVFGGHGFIRENGMEQIMRDARISTLYEGTTGVQALDLIGRKVLLNKFKLLNKFTKRVGQECSQSLMASGPIGPMARTLWWYSKQWKMNSMRLGVSAAKDRELVGSASVDYLMYSGYITLGYYWLRMAKAANLKIQAKEDPDGFYLAKLQTAQFYFERVLPRADAHATMMLKSPQSIMQVKEEHFMV
eukprot:PhM_4_TR11847/c0_g1_i1/m.11823